MSGVGSTEPPRSGGAGFAGAGAGMPDSRKNMIWGMALFGLMLALALGTVGVALIYLALD